MGQGRHTLRSVSDPVYPRLLVGPRYYTVMVSNAMATSARK